MQRSVGQTSATDFAATSSSCCRTSASRFSKPPLSRGNQQQAAIVVSDASEKNTASRKVQHSHLTRMPCLREAARMHADVHSSPLLPLHLEKTMKQHLTNKRSQLVKQRSMPGPMGEICTLHHRASQHQNQVQRIALAEAMC